MASIYVRMTDGRDRGHKFDMEREAALSLIQRGGAVHVAHDAPEFVADFGSAFKAPVAEVRLPTASVPLPMQSELSSPLAETASVSRSLLRKRVTR